MNTYIKATIKLVLASVLFVSLCSCFAEKKEESSKTELLINKNKNLDTKVFINLLSTDKDEVRDASAIIDKNWKEPYVWYLVEVMRFANSYESQLAIVELLQKHTDQDHGTHAFEWLQWLWTQEPGYDEGYAELKGELYKLIDPKFEQYFKGRFDQADIRLDEVVWGGVVQDGIPPLRFPEMIKAKDADYLEDDHIVFGFELEGVVRAYPKRILAWHEFFVDTFGEKDIAGVYCTLCGTVIAYDMTHDGIRHDIGTSGFLYRSNKVMYDRETQSLWNTIEGKPVIGPLRGKDIELTPYYLVTTTWGEWKRLHPETEVLSLNTGHQRNYGEGVAYQEYFATDELMFPVPNLDKRLNNKQEVLVLRTEDFQKDPIAMDINFLNNNPIYYGTINNRSFVVLTDASGANRIYDPLDAKFTQYENGSVIDENNISYSVQEDGLYRDGEKVSSRLPSHRIFWFAWFNTYPESRLIN